MITDDGNLSAARLNTPRVEAAASWVDGVGLVVAGGAADGTGAEVIADGEVDADDLQYPADPVTGAVATLGPAGEQLILLCGSDTNGPASIRILDVDCGSTCTPVPLSSAAPPLTDCSAHASGERVFLIGHNDSGIMESFVIDAIADTITPPPTSRETTWRSRRRRPPTAPLPSLAERTPKGSPPSRSRCSFLANDFPSE